VKSLLCAALVAMVPTAAMAEDVVAPGPAVDQPTVDSAALLPKEAPQAQAPQQAVEDAQRCGMHGCCAGGKHHGGGLVLVGVVGTVLTAVAVGVAVGVATHNQGQALQR
jgi:hypothetical protein